MANIMLAIGFSALAVFAAIIFLRQPGADREWSPALSRVAIFEETAPFRYKLQNVRAFEYDLEGATRKEWETHDVDANTLSEIWFFIEPFSANPLFAHSYLSFVFTTPEDERKTLSISIEARKEAGNPYSPLRGAFRAYELSYIWSTEKDIHSRIAIKLDHSLYAYKIDLDHDQAMIIFDHFVKRTNDLAERPRFYNTLHSNCTNELAKAVNTAFPDALPWHRSWVLTGRSGKWLHRLGFVKPQETDFKSITAQSDIQSFIKQAASLDADHFANQWRTNHAAGFSEITE